MTPQGVAAGKAVISLSVIALVLAALLGFVLVTSQLMVKTVTVTTTVIPTPTDVVSGSFSQHMLLLGSGNVSAIVSQYEGNANVTWLGEVAPCFFGTYAGLGSITVLMNTFIAKYTHALVIGNVTRTITAESNGSVIVNSTFGFTTQGSSYGIINGTVSAQDLYTYSTTNGAWLISHEVWDFPTFYAIRLYCNVG